MSYRIFLDPGHGGSDRANRGPTGYVEADGVLDIARRLRSELQALGFEVSMSRDKDATVNLSQRGKMAGQFKADLFLSIHSNAGSAVATGTEVYYSVNLPQTKAIAAKMSKAVANILGIPDRGAKVRESQNYPGEDYYTVIDTAQDTGVPRVFLIEVAFHSNPKEEALLKQPAVREKIARALADVIADTFGVQGTTPQITPMADVRGVVKVNSSLNVRNGPGEQYKIIGKLQNGDVVTINGKSGNWYRIKYNNGVAYVSGQYLVVSGTSSTPAPAPTPSAQTGTVKVNTTLNVRSGAGTQYKVVGSLKNGTKVEVLDKSGSWYKIKYGSITGYVSGQYLVVDNSNSDVGDDDVLEQIVLYLGDIDALSAIVVAQKLHAPAMRKSDFDTSGIKAKKIIQIGGGEGDRFDTFKKAAQYL
jgi:N-acetylmuramoyl-L-alanine amidase/uncharacterized protein YraI